MAVRERPKGSGHWMYDFRINGRRYRGAIPEARIKAQAKQAEAKVRTEIFEDRYGRRASNMSLARFVEDRYMPWSRLNKRSWYHDEYRARTLCESDSLRGKTLAEITPHLVERFKIERSKSITKRGTAPNAGTIENELKLLSRILTMAVDYKLLFENPCFKVKHFPLEPGRTRYLSAEEERMFMQTEPMRRGVLRHIVRVALGTGMRKEEILSLRWTHVDLQKNLVFVAKPKCRGDKRQTKGIPISSDVREVLLELQSKGHGEYVFANRKGERPSGSGVQAAFKKALTEAKIDDFRFHDLRHTFGTRLGDRSVSPFIIAELMGHSNIQMTARYTHPTEAGKRAAVECAKAPAEEDGHVLVTERFGGGQATGA
jgi:integrase